MHDQGHQRSKVKIIFAIALESCNKNINVAYSILLRISEYDYGRRTDSFKD